MYPDAFLDEMFHISSSFMLNHCISKGYSLVTYIRSLDIINKCLTYSNHIDRRVLAVDLTIALILSLCVTSYKRIKIAEFASLTKEEIPVDYLGNRLVEIVKLIDCRILDPIIGNSKISLWNNISRLYIENYTFAFLCTVRKYFILSNETKMQVLTCILSEEVPELRSKEFIDIFQIIVISINRRLHSERSDLVMNFEKMEKKVSSFPWNFNAPLRIDIEKIDEKFDNFRVILGKELGRGTYGVVHQVVKEGVPTGMVVKTMRRNELEHIIAEITTLLYCTGNCVPKFYAYDLIYSCGFFTCRILMSECTPVETLDASAVVMFLNALAEFHEQEFIHGDIKLANIMRSNGHLTLIDFGSSRKIPLMNYVPPTYSSGHEPPESIPYNSQISQKSDIWAFGITILTSFLSREEMFNGKMNIVRALMASSHDEYSYKCSSSIDKIISLIVELKEFVPSGFHRKIVDLCLVVDPGKRPTVKELLNISLE